MPKRKVTNGDGAKSQCSGTDPTGVRKDLSLLLCLTFDSTVTDIWPESDHGVQRQPTRWPNGGERIRYATCALNDRYDWFSSQDIEKVVDNLAEVERWLGQCIPHLDAGDECQRMIIVQYRKLTSYSWQIRRWK